MKKSKFLPLIFIIIMLIATYLPILVLVAFSFTESKTIGTWKGFSLGLYEDMFSNFEILEALKNTLIIGLVASLLAAIIGTLAAIGIYNLKKFPRKFMDFASQITMVNADIVTAVAFMIFFLLINIIPFGYATLIIAHTVICTPYVIMSVLPRLSQLDPNVYEAGLDLGAPPIKTLFLVILPQLVPAILSGFALAFTISLDDFTLSKFLSGSSNVTTIPMYLYNKMRLKGVMPVLRALSTTILVAAFIILLIINITTKINNKKNKTNPSLTVDK